MGIACVLACYFVFGVLVALFTGAILATRVVLRTKGKWPRILKSLLAFFFPFALLFYFMVAFSLYSLWCESVRNVDCGLGDSMKIPLTNGYALHMIDIPDHGFIVTPNGQEILNDTEQITMKSTFIFLKTIKDPSYHVLNTTDGKVESFVDQTGFEKYCQNRDMQPPEFQTVNRFYMSH